MNIPSKKFKIIVTPNAKANEIAGFDEARNAYRIAIKAKAEDNKANIELVKFLSKQQKEKQGLFQAFIQVEKS